MCRQIIDQLCASPLINEMCEVGLLSILSLYPDEDIAAWRAYLPAMPQHWINAYDEAMTITNERLYSLRAIPSLYLLDKEKQVLIKDGTNVAQIEDVISIVESQR
jgi:hypothetical protein